MILLIDNYDSFVHNLEHRIGELDHSLSLRVVRNDAITVEQIANLRPSHIVISPGPKGPRDAGISCDVIRELGGRVPILGVCLGHQCIAEAFGGRIVRNVRIMHGKTSSVQHNGMGLFAGLATPMVAMRYHSLVVEPESWRRDDFVTDAWTDEGEIMAIRHRDWPLFGVQFHPESFLTPAGPDLLRNFLRT